MVLLSALWLIPLIVFSWLRRQKTTHIRTATGIAFEAIASPASLGLYILGFWLGPVGLPFVIVGLVSSLFHGEPGWEMLTNIGVVPSGTVTTSMSDVWLDITNGLIWIMVYGAVGFILDQAALKRNVATAQ